MGNCLHMLLGDDRDCGAVGNEKLQAMSSMIPQCLVLLEVEDKTCMIERVLFENIRKGCFDASYMRFVRHRRYIIKDLWI